MTATIPAFAKINLSLEVVGRRADGYHELRTIFQTIDICDTLHFEITQSSAVELTCDAPTLETDERNLAVRAALALRRAAGIREGVKIHLEKRIPTGGGLGGGSSDAGATLLALRRLWRAEISDPDLQRMAAALGADVPFFLHGGTALGAGRGDNIETLPDAALPSLIVVNPGVAVPTARIFSELNISLTTQDATRILPAFPKAVDARRLPGNDLETAAFRLFPAVAAARAALLHAGATTAQMSGSGGSVFGFFENDAKCAEAFQSLVGAEWTAWKCRPVSRSQYREIFESLCS
jgi:4-diphosphocytidyl-2-C-methyl-D-erythritol kinase